MRGIFEADKTTEQEQAHDGNQRVVHFLWHPFPDHQQQEQKQCLDEKVVPDPLSPAVHQENNGQVQGTCPNEIEIVPALRMIGGEPHEQQEDAEHTHQEEQDKVDHGQ